MEKKKTEKELFNDILSDNQIYYKQLACINNIAKIIKNSKNILDALQQIVYAMPNALLHSENACARIKYNDKIIVSKNFKETKWILKETFETNDFKQGCIDIFYLKQFEKKDEGPFLSSEREILENISTLIVGYLNSSISNIDIPKTTTDKLIAKTNEQLKSSYLINQTSSLLTSSKSIEDTLDNICKSLPKAWQYPDFAVARITYKDSVYVSKNQDFSTRIVKIIEEHFTTLEGKKGKVEFIYLKGFPEKDELYYISEIQLLKNLANLICGFINIVDSMDNVYSTDDIVEKLANVSIERQKELECINKTNQILKSEKSLEDTLSEIVQILPDGWQYPEDTCARIKYEELEFFSNNFKETEWSLKQEFSTIYNTSGVIEIFYLIEFPECFEVPFLKEERDLINSISSLITAYLNVLKGYEEVAETHRNMQKIIAEKAERLKELACINKTNEILRSESDIQTAFRKIVYELPNAWQYTENACARISYDQKEYRSNNCKVTNWRQKQEFTTIDGKEGLIEIFYTKDYPLADEGPFLKEERDLLNNLASLLSNYVNRLKGETYLGRFLNEEKMKEKLKTHQESLQNQRKLLQNFLYKNNYDRDIFHDLMPFKVKEILLIANLYDAYSIEREGRFSDYILGDYHKLNLTAVPRITGVSSYEEAFEKLFEKHFDLIILMVGMDKDAPVKISEQIKSEFNYIPIFLLVNNNNDISTFEQAREVKKHFDNIFVWNGDSRIFFTMVKLLEDKVNLANDTKKGLSRIILLIEDSSKYYSRYLPLLYRSVMEQTRRIIDDISTADELYKILRLRVRPKILLASNYEEAKKIFDDYYEYFLSVITDVKFSKNGVLDENAGFKFAEFVKSKNPDLPIVIQSSDASNKKKADKLNCSFIYKNSDTLAVDIQERIKYNMGFGDFIYKDDRGNEIGITARDLNEFEDRLRTIPDDSLRYHALRNHFSLWLTARGEIQVAKAIAPKQEIHFGSIEGLRSYLIKMVQQQKYEKNKGKIVDFIESELTDESNIVALSSGALGGKGRGLAFVHTLIYNFGISKYFNDINIRAPRTYIIGTDEYDIFLERNNLLKVNFDSLQDSEIKNMFLQGEITPDLDNKLRILLSKLTNPLAIRSSGLFEDSLMQPFAGIFETYIVPNSHPDIEVRFNQLRSAIKLVYSSVFAEKARAYISAINYKIEEEKMAIVIQELVGNKYENVYYPHISGVAQSYNYYPFSHIEPEDGFAVMAVGLGTYVVEGEKSYRFSPKYPTLQNYTIKDLLDNSQQHFYAVDLDYNHNLELSLGEDAGLKKLELYDAEKHKTLNHCVSVYNPDNKTIMPGIDSQGPRVVNFADILKYNYIPLAQTIQTTLDIVKEALGAPVEIEFAVDLNKDKNYKASFYLLQIKPLIGKIQDYNINLKEIDKSKVILYTEKGMGNGIVDNLTDIIFVDKNSFDKSKTVLIAKEIAEFNKLMVEEKRQYVLIGPGRWGTRDQWIGIPVTWPQISNAKVIIETSLEGYPLDASSGSHFFHNVISMNVGYFSIQHTNNRDILAWNVFEKQRIVRQTEYIKHIRFNKPLTVKMDGKKRISVISWIE